MIKVKVLTALDKYYITIKGHANYSKYGTDIVCSAVSTLAIYNLNLLEKLGCNVLSDIREGDFSLEINPNSDLEKTIINLFISSLEEISKDYPRNLKIIKE